MKRSIVGAVLFAASVACNADSIPIPGGVFMSGNDYMQLLPPQRVLYLEGAMDGLMTGGISMQGIQEIGRCAQKMHLVSTQLRAIADKYMQAHPEHWGEPMTVSLFSALSDACQSIGAK
ncbi:hypothetical protein [Burkholderia vietnamiensis]|uniref:hypothetical protein n=1 Tax=Burkholderia vietnamiensis TaxID=60552 RepID=UPI001CC6B33C|nr:hypothetical protein [Burkholderia vietnamiensis]HDR9086389.1 hypothetical protein [Burkholderia vietnamiensis]